MITRSLCILILLLITVLPLQGADNGSFLLSDELNGFSQRVPDEALEYVSTPFRVSDNSLYWSLGVFGLVGVTSLADESIRERMQGGVRNRTFDGAADVGSLIGDPYLHIGLATLVYAGGLTASSQDIKQRGQMMLEALALADTATLVLKQGVGRGRPGITERNNQFKAMEFKQDYDSFPSMHTASSFALASVTAQTTDHVATAVAVYAAASFVGLARVYQNKHWVSDVLMGAALGELAGRVVVKLNKPKHSSALQILPAVTGNSVGAIAMYRF